MKNLAIILVFLLSACDLRPFDASAKTNEDIPLNEASVEEVSLIDDIKKDIAQIALSYGVSLDLDKLPIIVSDKQDIPNADGVSGYQGLCFLDENGKGTAILLSKRMLKSDLYEAEKPKKDEIALDTFRTLLHEVGHCYFGREHESNVLESKNFQLTIRQKKETYNFSFLPASIMDNSAGTIIPNSLKRYYVAEIIGYYRAKSLQEVADFISAEVTPVAP